MEQIQYPKTYYHGYTNLDDLLGVLMRLEERNEFFKSTESCYTLSWDTLLGQNEFIVKVILWKK